MKKVVFVFLLALGSAWNCHAQGWTWLQDSIITGCTGNSTTCDLGSAQGVLPTSSGTVWVVYIHTPADVTITSVSGGGGTWTLCPASSCHVFNATVGANVDMAYNLTGTAGTTHITVSLSGNAGSFFGANFVEIKPPSGSTASFDASGATSSASCTTCTAVGLTLSATDAVIQMLGGNNPAAWNSWSAPYFEDMASNGIGLNVSNGAAPTVTVAPSGEVITAIAFKSTAGSFTPPPSPLSMVSFKNLTAVSCSPSCSLAVPSTGSGHLLYLEAGNHSSNRISSVTGGGTWVAPSGANTCQITLSGSDALSCAYVLSSAPGATSLNVTMTGTCNCSFAVWEVATTTGTFALDVQGSATNAASFYPNGVRLPLTGSNDVAFQAIFVPGGTSGDTLYPYTSQNSINFFNTDAGVVARLNTADGSAPVYVDQQNNATVVSGIAFKTSGTGTTPAPPTGLNAVVH